MVSGSLAEAAGATITVDAGAATTFTGVGSVLAGTVGGYGSVAFVGGADTLNGTNLVVAHMSVSGATVTLEGTISNSGAVSVATPSLLIGAGGASLAGGTWALTDSSANKVTGLAAGAILNNVNATIAGAGMLGAGQMSLINRSDAVIDGNGQNDLIIDTGANQIATSGLIEATGAGGVTIQSAVLNGGRLEAAGGTLTVNGAVTGPHGIGVIAGGVLVFNSTFTEGVTFTAAGGVLKLAKSQSYTGAIFNFSPTGSTSLDLGDIAFVSSTEATYNDTSGVLTVTDGTHTAHITLIGDFGSSTFTASSDGHGGTIVTDPTTPKSATGPAAANAPAATQPPAGGLSINVATGQNASGVIQTAGDLPDANWTVTNADNYRNSPIAYTVAPGEADWSPYWFANGSNSSWICAAPDNSNNGNVTFTLQFNLTGYNPADATLVGGEVAMDDQGTVLLNGHSLGAAPQGQWESLHPISNGAGDFVVGWNTLVLQITGADNIDEAARLEGTIVDTVTTKPQIHWANPVSGSFTNASDWTGGVVPGAGDDAVLDAPGGTPYTVTVSTSQTVDAVETAPTATLSITGALTATNGSGPGAHAGTISVASQASLTLGGALDNTGTVELLGSISPATTTLYINADTTLTGGGNIKLDSNVGSQILASTNGLTLTNVDNTISGGGVIGFTGANSFAFVNEVNGVLDNVGIFTSSNTAINAGLIETTGAMGVSFLFCAMNNSGSILATGGSLIASFAVQPSQDTNTGLMGATGSGRLDMETQVDCGTAGVISATNGGVVQLFGATILGGTLETSSGGVFRTFDFNSLKFAPATAVLDGLASAVNNQGAFEVDGGDTLTLEGAINNTGTITIDASAGGGAGLATFLTIGALGATLTGGGGLVLSDASRNTLSGVGVLTNTDNTISGAGLIGNGSMSLVNQTAAVIDANDTLGLLISTGANPVQNAGLIEATGVGGLVIRNTIVNGSPGGVILAGNGSHIALQGADLIGGTLRSVGSGQIKTYLGGPNVLDGTASTVTNQALVLVQNSTALTIEGAILNQNRISLGSTGAATTLTIGPAGVSLAGGGEIFMGASSGNLIVGSSASSTLTNTANVIAGTGNVGGGQIILINGTAGVIVGEGSAAALIVDTGANTILNAGRIENTGKGGTVVKSAVNNTGGLIAEGGSLTLNGAVSGSGHALIYAGTLDFASSFSQTVAFKGPSGVLGLAQSQGFAATISGFSTTGGTSLDLGDIAFVSSSEATYSGTTTSGVLTVTDGSHTAHITLMGNYLASTFTASSDGHGGTIVVDPTTAQTGVAPTTRAPAHRFIAAMAGLGVEAAGTTAAAREGWRPQPATLARPGAAIA